MKAVWTLFVVLGLIAPPALAQDAAATDDNKPSDPAPAASESQPSESKPDESKPDESKPDDAKPDESKPDEAKPDEAKPDDAKPDDAKPDDAKPDDAKPDEAKPDESKPAVKPKAEAPAEAAPAEQPAAATGEFKTDKEKTSYAIGVSIGRGLKRDGADIDPALVGRGLADAFTGESLPLTDAQIREAIVAFQNRMRAFRAYQAENEAAREFLAENATKDGVVVLPSGLQYRVLEQGEGPQPNPTDTVEVLYTGKLTDDQEFDSSVDRDRPATFEVTGVIPGWTEALQLMKAGSKWELVIPSQLGYGENPRSGGKIKPGDVLVFEIELLGIKTPEKAGGDS